MKPYRQDEPNGPTPEQFAAYADGELAGAECAEVEAWLANHPEARAEVEALHRLGRLLEKYPPPEPDAAAWDAVLARIETRLPAPTGAWSPARRRLMWVAAALAIAAGVLLAVLFARPGASDTLAGLFDKSPPPPEREGPVPAPVEVLRLVDGEDIEIHSMDDADRHALVVGEPPLREALALATPDEVRVDQMRGDVEGMDAHFLRDGSSPPMIYMVPREAGPEGWEP